MSVNWVTARIPLSQGIDTKSDVKAKAPTQLTDLHNTRFVENTSSRKRFGYQSLSVFDAAAVKSELPTLRAIATRGDELVAFTADRVYSYSPAMQRWADRGYFESVIVTERAIAQEQAAQTQVDAATLRGVIVTAWEDSRGGVYYAAEDTGGGVLVEPTQMDANGRQPMVRVLGDRVAVYCWVAGNPTDILCTLISVDNIVADAAAAAVSIFPATPTGRNTTIVYDVVEYGRRNVIAFADNAATADITIGFVEETGLLGANTDTTAAGAIAAGAISLCVDGNAGHIRLFFWDSAVTRLYDVVFDHALSFVTLTLGPTIDGLKHLASDYSETRVNAAGDRVGYLYASYEVTGPPAYRHVRVHDFAADGAFNATAVQLRLHCDIASGARGRGKHVYVTLCHQSPTDSMETPLQNTNFLARYNEDETTRFFEIAAKLAPYISTGNPSGPNIPQLQAINAATLRAATSFKKRLVSRDSDVFAEEGVRIATINFSSSASHQAAQVGDALYLGGGYLAEYDGRRVTEAGFHLFVEDVTTTVSNGAGSLNNNGGYSYRIYEAYKNDRGEEVRSTCYRLIQVTTGASDDTIKLEWRPLTLTAREGVYYKVYRTEINPGPGALLFLVSDLDPGNPVDHATGLPANGYVPNDITEDMLTFVDHMADTALLDNERDYQNSTELDALAPSAASILAAGKNRLMLAGVSESGTRLRYSKLHVAGRTPEFNDSLFSDADPSDGPITAAIAMNDVWVFFTRRRIYLMAGDGPNNVGSGIFGNPQLASSDVGCRDARTVVLVPHGVMFQSDKGFYLLTQGFQVKYIGAPVELFNDQTFTSAEMVPDQNQVRFLAESGRTLAYDTLVGKWTTYPTLNGPAATVWINRYVYVTDNEVRVETPDYYLDSGQAYAYALETGWFTSGSSKQGYMRVRKVAVLGDFRGDHKLRVRVGYDYEENWTDTFEFDAAAQLKTQVWGDGVTWGDDTVWGGSADSVYQFKFRVPRQKVQAIRFRFEEILDPTAPGEGPELTEVAIEWAFKQGLNRRLGSGKQIG